MFDKGYKATTTITLSRELVDKLKHICASRKTNYQDLVAEWADPIYIEVIEEEYGKLKDTKEVG